MKKKMIPIEILEFDSPEELPDKDRALLESARAYLDTAYAPYSGFRVAAAVRLENGRVLAGANQENAAYPMCLCAERVALSAAASVHPGVPVEAIAVTVKSSSQVLAEPAAPCGACRQVICETEDRYGRPVEIILQGETGPVLKFRSGRGLLPFAFTGESL